jgi:SAM-dependent MidA family methyltransferase
MESLNDWSGGFSLTMTLNLRFFEESVVQMPEPSPLVALIRDRIRRYGPVSFPWFMEQALYHPEFGYYTSLRHRIGWEGDFYTNVSVSGLYGQLVAAQCVEMWKLLGAPRHFTIVEEGAEDGQLALDILSAINSESGVAYAATHYTIIEPTFNKQQQQRAKLEPRFFGKVTWLSRLADLEPVTGAFISNEFVDAMPVHTVEYRNGRWSELLVEVSGENFCFVPSCIKAPELVQALEKLPPTPDPYRTEVNLTANRWIQAVGVKLRNGFVLIVDYGYSRDEYYRPERIEGTLSCYSRHRRTYNPFERPGELDITSHVDFTSLVEAASQADLCLAAYTDQHHFMVGAAEPRLRALEKGVAGRGGLTRAQSAFLGAYRTLMHPGSMGMAFKCLLLTKGLSPAAPLSGFKYAREPHRVLGSILRPA